MKRLSLLVLLLCAVNFLKAQSSGNSNTEVIKEWAFLGESQTHLDVSYRVVKCSGAGQVHLQVFNESPNDQLAKMEIEITNLSDGEKITKTISYSSLRATIAQPSCDDEPSLNDLKIAVPASYDLTNIKVKITFK